MRTVCLPAIVCLALACTTTGSEESADATGDSDTTGASTGDLPPPADPGSFRFLTYNVAGLPQGLSSSDPELYIPQISPLLDAYDLVVAQEDFWYHDLLSADATHPHQSEPWSTMPTLEDIGDGLNRFSQTPFEMHTRVGWGDCNGTVDCASDCLATKGWSMARHTLAPGVEVDVYNLHMEAGGCPPDHEIRMRGAAALVEAATTMSEGRAVIMAGDYNLSPLDTIDLPIFESILEGAGLEDACWVLNCPTESIDRVLFRSSDAVTLTPTSWSQPAEFVDPMGDPLSDHDPTAVDFDYTPL